MKLPRGHRQTGPNTSEEVSCISCKIVFPPPFMVKDEVWYEAGFKTYRDGRICLRCFVKRLGRPLVPSDLNGSDLNDWWRREFELKGSFL